MNRTGFIAESVWSVIGPFDNKSGIGYNVAYIPENATRIDTAAQFPGVGGQIGWEKRNDETFDGYVDFNKIFDGKSRLDDSVCVDIRDLPGRTGRSTTIRQ